MDLPLLGISVALYLSENNEISDARFSLTVAAPTAIWAYKAEEFLKGKTLDDDVLREAGKIASSRDCCSLRDSLRCAAWYREEIIQVFVPRMARLAAKRIRN